LKILPGETKQIIIVKAGATGLSNPLIPRAVITKYESEPFSQEWDKPMPTEIAHFIAN